MVSKDEIIELLHNSLSEKRVRHTLAVADCAVKLAEKYGADPENAYIAALLHDITKEESLKNQLKMCEDYGIIIDGLFLKSPQLIHPVTAAQVAKRMGAPSEVCDAVREHTLGAPGMSTLSKCVWLADIIEPGRDFSGVEEIRALAERDLNEAIIAAMDRTVSYLKEKGEIIHPGLDIARQALEAERDMKMYGEEKLVRKSRKKAEKAKKPKKPKKPWTKERIIKVSIIVFLIIAALVCTGLALWYSNVRAPEIPVEPIEIDPANSDLVDSDGIVISDKTRKEGIYNILIVGTDLNGYHTDSIMIASYDSNNNKMNVLSIPRDTYINVRRSNRKINAAFAYDGNPGNVDKLYQEIESIIGFKPDKYVIVGTKGFVDMIDAIGGVEIDVPRDMKYNDASQDLFIDIDKGYQTLNGYDSMCFMRYRYGYAEGDVGRVRAQQTFVKALMDKMLKPGTLTKLPELVDIVDANVKTDLEVGNMIWLGTKILDMDLSTDLKTYILPGEGLYYQKLSYYFLYPNKTKELINEVFNPYVSPIERLDIVDYTKLTGKSFSGS